MKVEEKNKRQFFQNVWSVWRKQIMKIWLYQVFYWQVNFVEAWQKEFVSKEYSQVVNILLFRCSV